MYIVSKNTRQDQDLWIAMQDQEEQLCKFRADVSVSRMSTWSNVKSWTNHTKNTKCAPSCRLLPGADTSKLITSMKFRRAYSSSLPASVHAEPRLTRSNSEPHLLATEAWRGAERSWWKISWSWERFWQNVQGGDCVCVCVCACMLCVCVCECVCARMTECPSGACLCITCVYIVYWQTSFVAQENLSILNTKTSGHCTG
jgi:hypothetical protein